MRAPYTPRLERHPELVREPTNETKMVEVLDALQRHTGGLSTLYLFKLVCPNATDMANFRDFLKAMYAWSYIDLPRTLNSNTAKSAYKVYRLMPPKPRKGRPTDKGRLLLEQHNRLTSHRHPPSSYPKHDYMTACITASIELAAIKSGYTFIPWYRVLDNAPDQKTPFEIPVNFTTTVNREAITIKRTCIFDDVFGIDYNGSKAFFFLETDLNTEGGKILQTKFLCIQHIATKRIYEKHFGVDTFKALFVTTDTSNADFAADIIKSISKLPQRLGGKPGATYIAIQSIGEFEDYFTPLPLTQLFSEGWNVAGMEPYFLDQP